MYDAQTEQLIRAVPPLQGLDPERLPELLTEAYAEIVEARLMASTLGNAERDARFAKMRRLANTYEVLACRMAPEAPSRAACAFVAASAHMLVHRQRHLKADIRPATHVSPYGISSLVSAVLLFLISEAVPDASEAAAALEKELDIEPSAERSVAETVVALARGLPQRILEGLNTPLVSRFGDDTERDAHTMGWRRVLDAAGLLCQMLVGDAPARPQDVDNLILPLLELTSQRGIFDNKNTAYTLAGIHHTALLLRACGQVLLGAAIVNIPPPNGADHDNWINHVRSLAKARPLLWRNHREAIAKGILDSGTSAAMSFPTGAGKSALAQLKIASAAASGRSSVYLVPTNALIGQVSRDVRSVFPWLVAEDEEDDSPVQISGQSRVHVLTPEKCLGLMATAPDVLSDVGLVVFDECHLLSYEPDEDGALGRRPLDAMICLLNLLTLMPTADVLLISAMMANASEMAEWLTEAWGRRCLALDLSWKPTRQARGCVVYLKDEVGIANAALAAARQGAKTKNPSERFKRSLRARPHALISLRQNWTTTKASYRLIPITRDAVPFETSGWRYLTANRNEVAAVCASSFASVGVKTMVLSQDTVGVHSIARTASDHVQGKPPIGLHADERRLLDSAIAEVGDLMHTFGPVGAAAVHSGLLLAPERELSERLFRREDGASVLAVSPTMSMGVNLPAECIIIAGEKRFDAALGKMKLLSAHDLLNAAGRAGRAGTQAHGIVIVVPSEIVEYDGKALSASWHKLLEEVFSRSDQCLAIVDPLGAWLDVVSSTAIPLADDATYVILRMPFDEADREGSIRRYLDRSLAAFHAKKRGATEQYRRLVDNVVAAHGRVRSRSAYEWADVIALQRGLPSEVVASMVELILGNQSAVGTVQQWFDVWFAWASAEQRREYWLLDSPRRRVFPGVAEAQQIAAVKNAADAWMRGAPLTTIQTVLGKKRAFCPQARKFAIQAVPALAFGVSLLGHTWRSAAENGLCSFPPLEVDKLDTCLRRGVLDVEALAVGTVLRSLSRVQVHQTVASVTPHVSPRPTGLVETFEDVVQRVRSGIRGAGL